MTSPFPPFGNIFAPPWLSFSRVQAGIRDMENDLDLPQVTVATGAVSRSNALTIDNDSDYLCREINFFVVSESGAAPAPSDLRVRIRDGDGRLFTSDFIPILDLNGPFVPPWPLQRASVLLFDFQNIGSAGGASSTIWAVLKGWKRITCADQTNWPSPYRPLYSRYLQPSAQLDIEDFEYPVTVTVTGAGDQLRIPIHTDNDGDFYWRGITGDWNTANNDVAVTGNCGITFYDPSGLPIAQAPLTVPWGSPSSGPLRELILSSGGGRPAPIYPEIFIPRGGIITADYSLGAAVTLRFSLRGVKSYSNVCPS